MKKFFILAALPLFFASCEVKTIDKSNSNSNIITTEVVYRVELSASGSGSAMSGDKMILTESGKILRAECSEKSFFAREGDTIKVQTLSATDGEIIREKIIDIKFKK